MKGKWMVNSTTINLQILTLKYAVLCILCNKVNDATFYCRKYKAMAPNTKFKTISRIVCISTNDMSVIQIKRAKFIVENIMGLFKEPG